MNKELTQKLTDKYFYMFEEMRRSLNVMNQHTEYQTQVSEFRNQQLKDPTKKEELEIQINIIREKQKEIGCYWPIVFGFEHDDGWYNLLDELLEKIQELDTNKLLRIHQIKEKLGGLRFYTNGTPIRIDIAGAGSFINEDSSEEKDIQDIIDEAENKSYSICEICGKPGKLCTTKGRWLKTVCKEHRKIKLWHSDTEYQEYIPCSNFIPEENIITPDIKVQKIICIELNEQEDTWFCTLDNKQVFKQEELKRVPHNMFSETQFVKKDNTELEWIIKNKNYDPIIGWQYTIELDQSELHTTAITVNESELTAIFEIDKKGFNRYKRVKNETSNTSNVNTSININDNI